MGTGLFASSSSILLLYYLTDTLGVAAALAGLVLFIPKFWDVVFDPLVGVASDRLRSRWGRRQPFLVAGALLAGLAFWATFHLPALVSPAMRAPVAGLAFFVGMSGYALFAVPYAAMAAELSDDTHERTRIMAWRMGGALVGTLLGAVAAPMLVASGGGARPGHAFMGAVLAAAIVLAMGITAWGAGALPARAVLDAPHVAWREQLRLALSNRAYFVLLLGYVCVLVGNGAMAAAAPYFAVHVLGRSADAVGAIFGCLLVAAMAAMPLWAALSRRLGKHACAVASALVFAAALAALHVVEAGSPPLLLWGLCAVAGAGFAGTQLLPFSILTDLIHADTLRSGMRREGSFTGLFIAGEKAGLALGPLLTAGVLSLTGFVAAAEGAAVQPPAAVAGIAVAFTLVPAALAGLGAVVLLRVGR